MRKIFQEILTLLRLNTGRTNLKVVILCLVAATLFWLFNSLNKNYTANVRYPITFLYDTDSYQAVEELPDEVLLNMTGVGWNLLRKSMRVRTEPLLIRLESPDNTSRIPGSSLPSAVTDQVTDLQLNYVLTDTLYLNIDRRVTRYLKVWIDIDSLNLADDFVVTGPMTLKPDSVRLTGPMDMIAAIGDTIFLQVDENDIDENFEDELEVVLPNSEMIIRNPPSVSVMIPIERLEVLDLELPVNTRNFPQNYTLSDSTKVTRVWVRESMANQVVASELSLLADYTSFDISDSTVVPVADVVPSYVERIALDTTGIKVIIR